MRAGSRVSGLLVAIRTLMFPRGSNPSSWLMSSSIVLWTSLSPPAPSSKRAPGSFKTKRIFIYIWIRNNCVQAQGFTLASNGINFVKEYKTGLFSPRHLKQLTHHPGSLQQIFRFILYPRKWIYCSSLHWPLPRISAPAQSRWLWWSKHPSGLLRHERTEFFLCRVAQKAAHLLEAQYPG